MKHRIKEKKLNRPTSHRFSMVANLATSLIEHEQITTTVVRAKSLKVFADKLITLAKKGDLAARRKAVSIVRNQDAVAKLFATLGDRYKTRNGGYTRVIKYGFRKGDSAPLAVIEFVDRDVDAKGKSDFEFLQELEKEVQSS